MYHLLLFKLDIIFLHFISSPIELKSRVEATESLTKEINTRLEVTETKVGALEKIDQGTKQKTLYDHLPCF